MVEVPEHLLRRSRERRAALGLGEADAARAREPSTDEAKPNVPRTDDPPQVATPKARQPQTPEPDPPVPLPAHIHAAYARRRVPFWAMPVLAGLPLWAYVFFATLEPRPVQDDPVVLGAEVYGTCAGCHLGSGSGQGGVPALIDGAVLETWPDYRDHMMWVRLGSNGWPSETYGSQQKDKRGGMPAHEALSDEELAQVVLYERLELGGAAEGDVDPDLFAISAGDMTFADAGLGELSEKAGVTENQLEAGG